MTDRAYSDDPSRRRRRNVRIALLVVASLALFVAVLAFSVMKLTRPVVDTGDAFMTALREGDFPRAYALTAPALQQELGTAQDLAARAAHARPAAWSWSSRSIRNGTGRVAGSYTALGGGSGSIELMMRGVDGEWRITAFRFSPE